MPRRVRGPREPYVVVEMTVTATVELPEEDKYNGQACDDPAVEAALEALSQRTDVYIWGSTKLPARVYLEASEDEASVVEDSR